MEDIINHNCIGSCCQETCENDEEKFIRLNINGMKIFITFCKKHAEEFEEKFDMKTRLEGSADDKRRRENGNLECPIVLPSN